MTSMTKIKVLSGRRTCHRYDNTYDIVYLIVIRNCLKFPCTAPGNW